MKTQALPRYARFSSSTGAGRAVYVQRPNVRGEGITKVNEAWFGDHIRVRYGLAFAHSPAKGPPNSDPRPRQSSCTCAYFVAVAIGPVRGRASRIRQIRPGTDQHRTNCH